MSALPLCLREYRGSISHLPSLLGELYPPLWVRFLSLHNTGTALGSWRHNAPSHYRQNILPFGDLLPRVEDPSVRGLVDPIPGYWRGAVLPRRLVSVGIPEPSVRGLHIVGTW